jgi:2-polyprenyl-6-methoxyphenol hydroxylase-like FAD-dependent oxidoreductase
VATSKHGRAMRALIVGGGVAGPAAAIALGQAGIQATVFEASDVPRDDAGAFLNLAPNGLHVLAGLGLGPSLDGLGFVNDRLVFHNDAGRELAAVSVGGVTLMRGALSRRLREAAMAHGVSFEFDRRLTAVAPREDGVVATFEDGTEAMGDVLIGADGIRSRVRSCVFPEAPSPIYTGILNLGGVVRTDLPATEPVMHMVFGRRGFFGYAVRPSGDTYWFSNVPEPADRVPREATRVGADAYRQRLRDVHRDDPPAVRHIVDALDGPLGAYPIDDLPPLRSWHRDRVCLIGDAAHAIGPHVGQGVSLALEDAFLLAKALRDLPDVATAFAAFERLRRVRVEPVLTQSRRTGRQKAPSGWLGRAMRDLLLPVFLRHSARAAGELYRYRPAWDAPFTADAV